MKTKEKLELTDKQKLLYGIQEEIEHKLKGLKKFDNLDNNTIEVCKDEIIGYLTYVIMFEEI